MQSNITGDLWRLASAMKIKSVEGSRVTGFTQDGKFAVIADVHREAKASGILGGRILMLRIYNGEQRPIIDYDCGWNVLPAPEHREIVTAMVQAVA